MLRLDEMIAHRREMRELYKQLFAEAEGIEVFGADGDEADNVWLTSILVDSDVTGWSTQDLANALAVDNIECRPLWKPMHLQPIFADSRGVINGTSEVLFERGLTLPSGSALAAGQRARVTSKLVDFLGGR